MERKQRMRVIPTPMKGEHGFPVVIVEQCEEIARIESADPRELARELERQAAHNGWDFEVVGELQTAPDRPLPGWDPIADLLEGNAQLACSRCGSALESNAPCAACAVAGGGI